MSNDVIVMNGELSERANRSGLASPLFCEASPLIYTNYEVKTRDNIIKELGIDPNYSVLTDVSRKEGIQDGIVAVSYSTILKWVGIALAVGLVIWVLVYYYKKMK